MLQLGTDTERWQHIWEEDQDQEFISQKMGETWRELTNGIQNLI